MAGTFSVETSAVAAAAAAVQNINVSVSITGERGRENHTIYGAATSVLCGGMSASMPPQP